MKIKLTRKQIEDASYELTKCPCCGHKGFNNHSCGCSPEVFNNRINEIEIEIDEKPPKVNNFSRASK